MIDVFFFNDTWYEINTEIQGGLRRGGLMPLLRVYPQWVIDVGTVE